MARVVAAHLDWDDRGTAFATWRYFPNWAEGEWLGFRLCYVVEAGLPEGLGLTLVEAEGLRRRMDGYLSPWTESLNLDVQMQAVTDPVLLEILRLPYRPAIGEDYRDFNLGSRHEALYHVIDPVTLGGLCRQVRDRSESWLRGSAAFQSQLEQAQQLARQDVERRNGRLRRRLEAAFREHSRAEAGLERELMLNEALLGMVAQPRIRLDAIGLFILSSRPPQEVVEAYGI